MKTSRNSWSFHLVSNNFYLMVILRALNSMIFLSHPKILMCLILLVSCNFIPSMCQEVNINMFPSLRQGSFPNPQSPKGKFPLLLSFWTLEFFFFMVCRPQVLTFNILEDFLHTSSMLSRSQSSWLVSRFWVWPFGTFTKCFSVHWSSKCGFDSQGSGHPISFVRVLSSFIFLII